MSEKMQFNTPKEKSVNLTSGLSKIKNIFKAKIKT